MKWADKGVSGQNPGGSNSWEIGGEYQIGGALPALPLLDWERVGRGCRGVGRGWEGRWEGDGKWVPGGAWESRITKFTVRITFALLPP